MPRFRLRIPVLLLAVALVAAGCGDDDDDDADAADTTTTTAADDAAGATVEVTAVDYGFEGLPDTIAAGSTLTLTNSSDAEMHELVVFRLPDGEERTSDDLVQLPQEELEALFAGPPGMVLLAPPGGAPQIPAVGDGTLADPGHYVALCFIPTGADPEEYMAAAQASGDEPPQVEGGPPHFTQGMHADFTVE